ncbi:phenylalanine--tRNA ligase subunit beta [Candidatus Woesearchaeota archaeon CG10_big_fil_rev_8_21_14_0_10_32_9]|nr:MAG: phenylalanine--tRNA ligase subunit beta [Candidatus Woesearchaeota archaeon CG10_big_fil_rev_8_21_14_0_10_32_9]
MPTITLNKNRILDLLGKKIPDEVLKDRISYLGTDLEEITKENIVVEIFPNRPDLLSEEGFARALKTFMGFDSGLKKYSAKKSSYQVVVQKDVKEIRPYTACVVVKNLKLNEEKLLNIIAIQEKLHVTYGRNRKRCAIGVYPLTKISFPITYTALKPEEIKFVPLGENKSFTGTQILKQHKTGKEYGYLLENKPKFPVFIDSKNQILSMPPIINSEQTGKVDVKTKEVFIECSGFNFNVVSKAINMLSTAFADMGGELFEVKVKYDSKTEITPSFVPEQMYLEQDYVSKYLGTHLKSTEIIKLLKKMGFDAEGNTKINVSIPSYRTDVLHPIDLVEDIVIAYGFENIKEDPQRPSTTGKELFIEKLKRKIREILIGTQYIEIFNFSLINSEEQKQLKLKNVVKIKNSLSSEYDSLRKSLIPSVLRTYKSNKHYEYPQFFFEIGTIFMKNEKKDTLVEEQNSLCISACGENVSFTTIKQELDSLLNSFNVEYSLIRVKEEIYIEGRSAKIIVNKEEIGCVGEIHPNVLNHFEIDFPISILEIDVDKLSRIIQEKILEL